MIGIGRRDLADKSEHLDQIALLARPAALSSGIIAGQAHTWPSVL